MNKLFWLIYIQPLHRIMIFMILAAVLWGYLGNREQGSRRWRILNAAVFAGIAAVIFYMTVCARGEETAEAVLVPFHTELQLKSLKKILIARSSYETCFVISFLINHKTGSAIWQCLPD